MASHRGWTRLPASVGNHLTIMNGFKHLEPCERALAQLRFGQHLFHPPLRANSSCRDGLPAPFWEEYTHGHAH